MSITDKGKAQRIKKKQKENKQLSDQVQSKVSEDFHKMVDEFHSLDIDNDKDLDIQLLKWKIEETTDGKKNLRGTWDDNLPTFSPSSSSNSDRDLVFKIIDAPQDEQPYFPYQKRWTRNGRYIHDAMQSDLIYMEKYLEDAPFEVMRTKEGKPAWERNTRTVKQFEHEGVKFQIYGMVDGMLFYKPDGKRIGYDFKTKSTTIASVGDYKLKVPHENHILQMVAYSLLFDVDEYIIHYESLAKDFWTKGAEARPDMKVFHIKITEEMKNDLLSKFARIVKYVHDDILPPREPEKELFSRYKGLNEQLELEEKENGE